MRHFCAACACGIEGHEQNAVKGQLRRVNQSGDLFLAPYLRKVKHLLRIGRLSDAPVPLQDLDVKEAQRGQAQTNSVGAELQLAEQSCLILGICSGPSLSGWRSKYRLKGSTPCKYILMVVSAKLRRRNSSSLS